MDSTDSVQPDSTEGPAGQTPDQVPTGQTAGGLAATEVDEEGQAPNPAKEKAVAALAAHLSACNSEGIHPGDGRPNAQGIPYCLSFPVPLAQAAHTDDL